MNRSRATIALAVTLVAACAQAEPAPDSPSVAPPATSRPDVTRAPSPTSTAMASSQPTPTPTAVPDEAFTTLPNGVSVVDLEASSAFMGVGDDAIWLTVQRDDGRDILRVDPVTLKIETRLRALPTLRDPSAGLGAGGSIWIGEYGTATVHRYDEATGEELDVLEVGDAPYFPVRLFDDIWIPLHEDGAVARIDPRTGRVAATIDVANAGKRGPLLLDTGDGLVWETSPNTPRVVAIDPSTNTIVRSFELDPECQPSVASWLRGRLLVSGCPGAVRILDAASGRVIGETEHGVSVGVERLDLGDLVWGGAPTTTDSDVAIAGFDPDSLDIVTTFQTGVAIEDWYFASGFDAFWVASGQSGRVIRIPASVLPPG